MLITAVLRAQGFEKWAELRDRAAPFRESLTSAASLYDSSKWYASSFTVPTTKDDVSKFLADLAEVEKLMSGEFAGVTAPPGFLANDILGHPEAWLEIARARTAIIAKVKGQANADKAVAEVKFLRDITEKIKANDGWGLTENGLNIFLGKREEVRKKLCGGEKYPGWDEACDDLIQAAKDLAPKNRSYAKYSDAGIESRIRSGWAKNYKDRKILKVACAKQEWTVVKNSLGVPKYRSKGAAVRYTVPGCSFVIEQTVSILEDYGGSGGYKYRPTAQVPDYRILAP